MSKVTATIEVEFEMKSEGQATPALVRIPGELAVAIEFGSPRSSATTGVVQGSVKAGVSLDLMELLVSMGHGSS